ncbi:ead/Ea22-like family protein [Enterobacter hormaechei]|nr:ead/Ea22-like family protein [Enterobacter hormaechei]
MSNNDKQTLRQLAVDAKELAIIKRYTKGIEAQKKFIAVMTPATVLALLDELEAAESRIAELKAREVSIPDYTELYKGPFAVEVEHQVKNKLTAAGIRIQGEV